MWHIARKFIMHVVIMPLPFLVPAIFIEYLLYKNVSSAQTSIKERTHLFRPLKMTCYACYCLQAFYFYFIITGKNNSTRSCVREFHREKIKDSTFIYCFHHELPQRMLARLHLFRRFSLELWGHILPHSIVPRVPEVFIEYVRRKWRPKTSGTAVKTFLTSWSSCTVSISTFLKLPIIGLALFVVNLFFVFVQIFNACFLYIIGLVAISPFLVICPFASSGLWQLMDVNFLHRYILFPVRLVVVLLDMLVFCLATFGVVFV